jgi:hypothetical protein
MNRLVTMGFLWGVLGCEPRLCLLVARNLLCVSNHLQKSRRPRKGLCGFAKPVCADSIPAWPLHLTLALFKALEAPISQ